MAEDLEHRLQTYAYSLISGAVKQEYENMIDAWGIHIEKLVGYARTALKRHENVLREIQKSMAEYKAQQELAMLVFSFLGGPAVSWLSGAIQYRMVPRFLGKRGTTNSYVVAPGPSYIPSDRLIHSQIIRVYDKQAHDKVAAKVFGDFGGKLAQTFLVNPLLKPAEPNQSALGEAINRVGESLTLDLFVTNIRIALTAAKIAGGTFITNYAGTILQDHEFGKKLLKPSSNRQQMEMIKYLQRPIGNVNVPADLQSHGESMIRDAIDVQRRAWASKPEWFYFGNNPRPLDENYVINAMEVEIWRIWILTEDFQRYQYSIFGDDITEQDEYRVKGRSGIDIDKILTRLVELGVVAGRDPRELKEWMNRWNLKHKELGLLSSEVGNIKGFVDSDLERDAILNWAKERKPNFIGGQRWGTLRRLSPIDPMNVPTQ